MENMRCLSGLRACWRQSGRGKGSEKGLHDFIYLFRILDSAIKHIIYCHLHYALKKTSPIVVHSDVVDGIKCPLTKLPRAK